MSGQWCATRVPGRPETGFPVFTDPVGHSILHVCTCSVATAQADAVHRNILTCANQARPWTSRRPSTAPVTAAARRRRSRARRRLCRPGICPLTRSGLRGGRIRWRRKRRAESRPVDPDDHARAVGPAASRNRGLTGRRKRRDRDRRRPRRPCRGLRPDRVRGAVPGQRRHVYGLRLRPGRRGAQRPATGAVQGRVPAGRQGTGPSSVSPSSTWR